VSGTLVGSSVGLEIVGDGERKSDWVGGEEGVVALASTASASALGRAWPSMSCCDGAVDSFRQVYVAVLHSKWEVAASAVLGGRLVGAVARGGGLSSSALAASEVRRCLPGVAQTPDPWHLRCSRGWVRVSGW